MIFDIFVQRQLRIRAGRHDIRYSGCGGWSEPVFYGKTVNYEGFLANTVACGGVSGLDGNSFSGDSSCEFIPITEINVDFAPSDIPGMPSGPGVPEAINGLNFTPPSLTDEVCFVAGYEIELADGSIWKIEDLQVGQELWAPSHDDPNGPMRKCRISKVFHNDPKPTVIVRFDNGLKLQGTENHLFWVPQRGWTCIADLQIGDSCIDKRGDAVSIVSKELVSDPQPVYNIEVEGAHTYFIGKGGKCVLVHNECELEKNLRNPSSYRSMSRELGVAQTLQERREAEKRMNEGALKAAGIWIEAAAGYGLGKALGWLSRGRNAGRGAKAADKATDAGKQAGKHADDVAKLRGVDFEKYLTKKYGGTGSFSKGGRQFDGATGNRWWEAKSGRYWQDHCQPGDQFNEFKTAMGQRQKIARDNNAILELHSNSAVPQHVLDWCKAKGIKVVIH